MLFNMACLLHLDISLGLNFGVTPKTVPTEKIIAATEVTAKQLRSDEAEKLRTIVSNALRTTPLPRSNLPSHLQRAIRGLRDDDTIVVLLADKGNVTVVMAREELVQQEFTHANWERFTKFLKHETLVKSSIES